MKITAPTKSSFFLERGLFGVARLTVGGLTGGGLTDG